MHLLTLIPFILSLFPLPHSLLSPSPSPHSPNPNPNLLCCNQSDDKESDSSDESELGIATAESEKTLSNGKYNLISRHNNGMLNGSGTADDDDVDNRHNGKLPSSEMDFAYTNAEIFSNGFMEGSNNGAAGTANFDIYSGNNSNDSNNSNNSTTEAKMRRKKKYRRRKKIAANRGFSVEESAKIMDMDMDMGAYESSRLDNDDDHDWCEDSMAVELSSVDSTALNDFRSCGFNMWASEGAARPHGESLEDIPKAKEMSISAISGGDAFNNNNSGSMKMSEQVKDNGGSTNGAEAAEVEPHKFGRGAEVHGSIAEALSASGGGGGGFHADSACRSADMAPREQSTYSTDGPGAGEKDGKHGSIFMALADASRASDWLQQQAAVAGSSSHGIYQPYVQSVLGSFFSKGVRDTEGTSWDSDRSIATSLFVEVRTHLPCTVRKCPFFSAGSDSWLCRLNLSMKMGLIKGTGRARGSTTT